MLSYLSLLALPLATSAMLLIPETTPAIPQLTAPNFLPSFHQEDVIHPFATRVNLTLGVMSRCPDALFAEASLDKIFGKVNEKIRLEISYIGEVDEEEELGVRCKHGEAECQGNIQQLCLQHLLRPSRSGRDYDLSPTQAQSKLWSFIQCQNYDGLKNIGSIGLVKQCLQTVKGPPFDPDVQECIEGSLGRKLLKDSVKKSKKRGIEKSATIQLEGKTICIRDDGQWKDCPGGHEGKDWVRQIEDAWKGVNSRK